MRRYDITMISLGIIWLWVILGTVVVLRGTSPAQEIMILEIDGAIASMLTLWLKRPSFIGKTASGVPAPSASQGARKAQ